MKYTSALAKLGLGLVSAAALAALPSASAQATASKEKAASTLTVVYEFTGSGVEKPASKEKHVNWDIKDRYELKTSMVAKKPSGFGALHKADAATQAREANRQATAESAAKDMAPLMAQAEKIMQMCGDDEACMNREAMKMASMVDPSKAASAKSKIESASVMPADRYQLFESTTATGTYNIDERSYEAYFDAACSFKNEATCAINKTVKGSGALTDGDNKTTMKGMVIGELDMQAGSLIMTFPLPGAAKATKTITSASKDQKSSTEAVTYFLSVPNTQDIQLTAKCGACKTATGTFTKELDDKLLGRKGTLKVTWTFNRG